MGTDCRTKVCFISLLAYPYFSPSVNALSGGAELQLYCLATELARDERFDVHFVTGDYGQPDTETIEDVRMRKLAGSGINLGYVRGVRRVSALWRLLREIDAQVYIQRAWGSVTAEVALFCRAAGRRFIYMSAHDDDFIESGIPDWFARTFRARLLWKTFRLGLRMADVVVVQSTAQKDRCERLLGKTCAMRRSSLRAATVSPRVPRDIDVLWVARCEAWKQPELFVDLAQHLPERRFLMICPRSGDGSHFDAVRERARGAPNLEFRDFVAFNEVQRHFAAAKLFVNTSRTEGFPNTFLQAMMSGTPLISLSVNPDDVLERRGVGRCAGGDTGLLRRLVEEYLADGNLWRETSQNARRCFEEEHDISRTIERDKEVIAACARLT